MNEIRCYYECGRPLNPNAPDACRRVAGWERKASGDSRKSGSDILHREPLDEWAHLSCVELERAGISVHQQALV